MHIQARYDVCATCLLPLFTLRPQGRSRQENQPLVQCQPVLWFFQQKYCMIQVLHLGMHANDGKLAITSGVMMRPIQYRVATADLVDTSQRHTVDLEWACHQKQPRLQLLEEYNSLALKSASQKDQN